MGRFWDRRQYGGSTPSCRVLEKCDEACYASDNIDFDEREAYMMLPEVVMAETQRDAIKEILESKVVEAREMERMKNHFRGYLHYFNGIMIFFGWSSQRISQSKSLLLRYK